MKDKAKDQIDQSLVNYVDAMHLQNIAVMEMLMNENKYLREKEREDKASFEGRFVKIFDEAKSMGLVDRLMQYMIKPPGSGGSSGTPEDEKSSGGEAGHTEEGD